MVSRVLSRGRGAVGAIAYVGHDAPTAEDPRPRTYARVAGVAFRGGLAPIRISSDPEERQRQLQLAGRIMQATIRDAPHLKRAAGKSARGRPLTTPIETYGLSWPADERPSWKEMLAAGDSWLEHMKLHRHHFVLVAHVEVGIPSHLQMVGCLVDPEDGMAYRGNRALGGSRWAQKWEQTHGGIKITTRVERNGLRDRHRENKQEIARALQAAGGDDAPPAAKKKAAEDVRVARAQLHAAMPATEPTRSNGGRSQMTPQQRAEWHVVAAAQEREAKTLTRQRPTTRAGRIEKRQRLAGLRREHHEERRALGHAHRIVREMWGVAAQSRHTSGVVEELFHAPAAAGEVARVGPPGSLVRAAHVTRVCQAWQARGHPEVLGRGPEVRALMQEARAIIIDANIQHHVRAETALYRRCAQAVGPEGDVTRDRWQSLLRRTGGPDGEIAAALIERAPPSPTPDAPGVVGHESYTPAVPLLLVEIKDEIDRDHERAVARNPQTGPEPRAVGAARRREAESVAAEEDENAREIERAQAEQEARDQGRIALTRHIVVDTARRATEKVRTVAGRLLDAMRTPTPADTEDAAPAGTAPPAPATTRAVPSGPAVDLAPDEGDTAAVPHRRRRAGQPVRFATPTPPARPMPTETERPPPVAPEPEAPAAPASTSDASAEARPVVAPTSAPEPLPLPRPHGRPPAPAVAPEPASGSEREQDAPGQGHER